MNDYIKSTDELPKEATPVWVRICGSRPRKMYRLGRKFFYYTKSSSATATFQALATMCCGDTARNRQVNN